jgi:DNA-binding SARP family transcriptional activator
VLIGAAMQRGDRTTARRLLDRCEAMLEELGATPSPASEQLRRRILGVAAA